MVEPGTGPVAPKGSGAFDRSRLEPVRRPAGFVGGSWEERRLSTQLDTEWSVIQAVLRSMSVHRHQLVARESIDLTLGLEVGGGRRDGGDAYLREQLGDLPQDLLASFDSATATCHDLLEVFPALGEACAPVRWRELETGLWGRLGRWGIRLRHPLSGGVVSLSRVGFDNSRTQAIACCGRHSGLRAGAGWYKLLRNVSGSWRVARSAPAWVS